VIALLFVAGLVLAACGSSSGTTGASGEGGSLVVDNWIEYIDCASDAEGSQDCGIHPTIDAFTEETGITVDYQEGVNTNEDWFGKYQAQLSAGEPLGIDIVVLTDYMAARMIRLGYVEPLDRANIPNAGNLTDALGSPGFDIDREYTMPWQGGFTGLAYDIAQTGRELTSLSDILDPAFAGKVGILDGYADTVPLFLLMDGIDPAIASVQDYVDTTFKIKEAIDSGQIRSVYGNDYLDALQTGDLAVSFGWSGDIVSNQADFPDLKFSFPEEGYMIFTDNMMIPKGAANKANAEAWINWYYDPEIAAELSGSINYLTPVDGALEVAQQTNPEVAANPLVFATPEVLENAYIVRAFTEEEEEVVNEAFSAATGV
jgi:spermidine/putrescine transport system substrate-binding protein